ncbi:MAG: polyamine ABC transporter substrate-binding protein [Gammaproteobacteria bacterium]|uniref:Putrescine-binding periplasmic protein n=1 Tax=Marinomonas polaris DSM 16579 TaxID=1122206 RepID=A0A1M5IP22_9GAMM|nr:MULTISPECIES: polyamine ABC transporter substrate-binding protein [Marinomonas]MBU1293987.1 polyamine ABC transporter substrate-binding protein [Gammaproteobacteria bacterium]MBU1468505.1 polyamine ABC transporter substrate-binding protein [Gammaproteobacteria bacterium]MBU2022135.1 polyamine ABC transporter substrate-binding protein [Gammaproteobacteria bacterium]MBU2240687.1 polyamine ABC transporter substrate-binding protein [Gammaproteobacteria bacterium]MBU2320968.1 polyamine ABC trans
MKNKTLGFMLACAASSATLHAQDVVNIYNWSDYMAPGTLEQFTAETGIKVNYDVYDSNEALEAKMMAGGSGYDVVMPSNSFFERQVKAGVYQTIDKSKLSNIGNLDGTLLKQIEKHDAGNQHNIPYAWGTIGIGYNTQMIEERLGTSDIDSWDILFNPEIAAKLKDCGIAVLDSPAEVMSIANNYRQVDPNTEDTKELEASAKLMSQARPFIKYFHSSTYISDLANGEICVAIGYNGDILQSQGRAEEANQGVDINFVIPKEGTLVWFDLMAIPADAPHPAAALAFINYILRPEVAASISNYVYYAVPNKAAEPLLDDEVVNNKGIYPTQAVKDKLYVQVAHTARFDRSLTRAWTNIKTGR